LEVGYVTNGIRASSSNTGLYGPRTSVNFEKFVVTVLFVMNLGKNSERLKRNPQIHGKNLSLNESELF
jgi:hypothetical protein